MSSQFLSSAAASSSEMDPVSPTNAFQHLENRTTMASNEDGVALPERNKNKNDGEGQCIPLWMHQADPPPMLDALLVASKYEDELTKDGEYHKELNDRISSLASCFEAWSMGPQAALEERYGLLEEKIRKIREKEASQGSSALLAISWYAPFDSFIKSLERSRKQIKKAVGAVAHAMELMGAL
ncbi:hypothetical protein FRC17_009538 [Serendipita sp. 399]|nr:hypothetical protein FRC17_009538 [Serendipita sp. 399]